MSHCWITVCSQCICLVHLIVYVELTIGMFFIGPFCQAPVYRRVRRARTFFPYFSSDRWYLRWGSSLAGLRCGHVPVYCRDRLFRTCSAIFSGYRLYLRWWTFLAGLLCGHVSGYRRVRRARANFAHFYRCRWTRRRRCHMRCSVPPKHKWHSMNAQNYVGLTRNGEFTQTCNLLHLIEHSWTYDI